MIIHSAEFEASYPSYQQCPDSNIPEYAFIGRSNVGKSSLINMLTNHKKLAKTSGTPGKTQLINYFLINEKWRLVDLPGYGYAKVSKSLREEFQRMIRNFLLQREQIVTTFVLIDSRIRPQANDLSFLNWMGENILPFAIIFTKVDKQNGRKTKMQIEAYKKKLSETWEVLPPIFKSSSEKAIGRDEILGYIEEINATLK